MTLRIRLHFSLLNVAESVTIERAGVRGTAGGKSLNVVRAVLVQQNKIGVNVVGKSKIVQRALEGILDELDCRNLHATLAQHKLAVG